MGGRIMTGSVNCSDITVNKDLIIEYSNSSTAIAEGTKELEVTVNRREYSIVGDELYIPKRYEDAPQWLRDIIDTVTSNALSNALNDVSTLGDMLDGLIAELNVAKNTYTQSIISSNDIDERINTAITTLNSTLADSDSTILDIALTRVTPEEAQTIAIGILSASIAGGDIAAAVQNLQSAIADVDSARALDYTRLTAQIGDGLEEETTARAEAVQSLNTYVGIATDGGLTGTGLLADVSILQKQNDGIIETVTGTYDVMVNPENPDLAKLVLTAEPYATWRAADVSGMDTRLAHIGDVYIKYSITDNGAREYIASYKFIRTVVDTTSPFSTDNHGFTWALIVDQASQDAYNQALSAYDLADNKRRVFTATPRGPYDEGDLWVKVVSGSNQIWKCQVTREQLGYYNAADWSIASTDDTATVALQTGLADGTVTVKLTNAYVGTTPFLTYLTNEIDSKVGVFSGETAPVAGQPSGVATNDIYLWFTTASKVLANGTTQVYDITRTYKYSGSVWNEITTDSNITALADLADGKRTVFSGSTVPVGAVARDIWIPSASNGSYLQGEIYQYSGAAWVVATKYSADLEAVRSNLQSQVDGKVETYYQATVPTGMASVNNGDYWYCTADVSTYKKGKVYKYVHATTSWVETADVSRYAFDTADGKAAIFLSTSTPTAGYKLNDMLIVIGSFNNGTTTFSDGVVLSSNANRVSGFTASDWVKKINDTEDLDEFVSVTYTPTVTSLQNQVDGKIESWYTASTSDPKIAWTDTTTRAKHEGDMWYQTDTKNSYWYSSSTHSWNLIDDAKAIQALANAATAQATADGVVVSFYAIKQDTAPTTTSMWLNKTGTKVLKEYKTDWINVAVQTGDTLMAYDTVSKDMSTYVYNGSGWITNTENGIVAGSEAITTLTANLSTTNTTVSGHTTQLNTVDTRISSGMASVETKWAYNSIVNINGVYKKSGFGLTTNYTSGNGTEANPYVSEFWIDASRLKFTNSNQTGQTAPFTIDATGATPQVKFNGVVEFSNITDVPSLGTSSNNLLTNSAPTLGNETYGWQVGWYSTNIVPNAVAAGFDIWRPTGAGSVYVVVGGAPIVGKLFDIKQSNNIPVVAGKRYEISALLSSHRCTSVCTLAFFNSAGTYISEIGAGTANSTAYLGDLSNWVRKGGFVTVPAGTSYAQFYVRSAVTGTDPYCFVAQAYMGEVSADRTEFSSWSEGVSANSTTIDGGKITTGTVSTDRLNVNAIMAKDMTFTGKITGGSGGLGGIIQSYNGSMVIDLVNGSIYIS